MLGLRVLERYSLWLVRGLLLVNLAPAWLAGLFVVSVVVVWLSQGF